MKSKDTVDALIRKGNAYEDQGFEDLESSDEGLSKHAPKLKPYFDKAMKCYDKAIEIDPKDADAWNVKGGLLDHLNRFDEAITCYDKALKINPKYAWIWCNKGHTLTDLKKFDEAIKCYDEALKINPRDAQTWANRGDVFLEMGKKDEAKKSFEKAHSLGDSYSIGND